MVARDPSSNTSDNLKYLLELTNLSPWDYSSQKIKCALPVKTVPENEKWRLGLLSSLLSMRKHQYLLAADRTRLTGMIDSLCST
jgi:hypothetical protein